jgi:hypothetical protein
MSQRFKPPTKEAVHNARIDIVRGGTRVDATPFRRIGRASSEQDCSLQLQRIRFRKRWCDFQNIG